jgi:ribosomal subunit interface protein
MTLRVSGKNLDIGESLRAHVGMRIDGVVAKYSTGLTGGHVTIEREGSGFRTDCTLHLVSGGILQVEAEAQEPYASFNIAADRVEKRLRRHKDKLKCRTSVGVTVPSQVEAGRAEASLTDDSAFAAAPVADMEDGAASGSVVIVESFDGFKEMSVSTAVKELDITNAHVVIFRHAGDERPNIVYRRADGNIGWIDPAHSSKA